MSLNPLDARQYTLNTVIQLLFLLFEGLFSHCYEAELTKLFALMGLVLTDFVATWKVQDLIDLPIWYEDLALFLVFALTRPALFGLAQQTSDYLSIYLSKLWKRQPISAPANGWNAYSKGLFSRGGPRIGVPC